MLARKALTYSKLSGGMLVVCAILAKGVSLFFALSNVWCILCGEDDDDDEEDKSVGWCGYRDEEGELEPPRSSMNILHGGLPSQPLSVSDDR